MQPLQLQGYSWMPGAATLSGESIRGVLAARHEIFELTMTGKPCFLEHIKIGCSNVSNSGIMTLRTFR